MLSSITALRKLVNHPKLIYDAHRQSLASKGSGGKIDEGAAGFEDCEKVRGRRGLASGSEKLCANPVLFVIVNRIACV